ncbi:MAG: glyoxalase/Bleomycin resistance/Dioxygenase superfamily protein [Alphaproteobacteria bacterium]|nr:glyoxalase/Bleomycin resistance/Dioxygenase superfamily protein [Alphaproteobacteria bacterium]
MTAQGIHHITAIASDPKRNFDFYTKILGLRFIKKTVNFDDPGTYHFYFADRVGTPGTVLTFFPHPGLPQGRAGLGQAVEIVFAIPKTAFSFWLDRFHQKGIVYQGPEERFDEKILRISDPDGLQLEFVGVDDLPETPAWTTDEIAEDVAIRGFHSVALWVKEIERTENLLTEYFGFKAVGVDGSRHRYSTGQSGLGQIVDIRHLPGIWRGGNGAGTIHHVAFRVGDDEEQKTIREKLADKGVNITPVVERDYFRSLYFREPSGILFEIATDGPGFAIDEPVERLGQALMLPARYEPHRKEIAAALPSLDDA